MKTIHKTLSVILCLTCLCPVFAGCHKGPEDTENTLIIEVYDGGYGTSFATRLGKRFEELNEGCTVVATPAPTLTQGETEAKLKNGPKYTATDMFFANTANFNQYVSRGGEMVAGYDCVLEDLSGMLDEKVYGEEVTVREKMRDEYLEYFTYRDGNVYALSWASGVSGIVYHSDVFEEKGWEVPLTTDQMTKELFPKIKAQGWSPVTWPGAIGYWIYGIMSWWAQYEGIDAFNDFFRCKDENGDYTYEFFSQNGRYEALQVLEDIIADKNGNSYYGSVSLDHTRSQMAFLETDNKIAMMPNGDWLENEMSKNFEPGSVQIKMMKTPIVSAIIDKTPSISNDAKLREVVAYVDAETAEKADSDPGNDVAKPSGVTDADIEIIRQARRISFSNGFDHEILIPSYANAKKLAKDFIRFMASDEAQKIYFEETGSLLPFKNSNVVLDNKQYMDGLTTFGRSKFDLMTDSVNITTMYYYDPLFYKAGMRPFNKIVWPDPAIGGVGGDAVSAVTFFQNEYNYVKDRWDDYYLVNAGIANM